MELQEIMLKQYNTVFRPMSSLKKEIRFQIETIELNNYGNNYYSISLINPIKTLSIEYLYLSKERKELLLNTGLYDITIIGRNSIRFKEVLTGKTVIFYDKSMFITDMEVINGNSLL